MGARNGDGTDTHGMERKDAEMERKHTEMEWKWKDAAAES